MSLATSYAKALFEAAKDANASTGTLDQLENEMDSFGTLLASSKDLRRALFGPLANSQEKAGIVESVSQRADYSTLFKNFLGLLAKKDRLASFADIREAFLSTRLEAEGALAGKVVSADPVSDAEIKDLSAAFTRRLGKRIALRADTDPSLLAGVKVTINGTTYDGSLRSQLQQLRDAVMTGYAAK